MKASEASVRIAEASQSEAITRISSKMFGRTCTNSDARVGKAERAAGLDEIAPPHRDGRAARDARERRHRRERDRDDDVDQRRAEHRRRSSGP